VESAYSEAEEHLAMVVVKRREDPEKALAPLRWLARLMELTGTEVYGKFEAEARERLGCSATIRSPSIWRSEPPLSPI
jgi:hypothetical protein